MLNEKLVSIVKKIDKNPQNNHGGFCHAFSYIYNGWRLQRSESDNVNQPWPFSQLVSFILNTPEAKILALIDQVNEEKSHDIQNDEGLTRADFVSFFNMLLHFQYSGQGLYRHWSTGSTRSEVLLNAYGGEILQKAGDIKKLAYFSGIFNSDALLNWLDLMSRYLKDLQACVAFVLESDRSNHAISIVFEKNQWTVTDVNLVAQVGLNKTYSLDNLSQMVKDVGYSLEMTEQEEDDDFLFTEINLSEDAPKEQSQCYLCFSMLSTGKDENEVRRRLVACQATQQWQQLFSLDNKKTQYQVDSIMGISFFHNQDIYNASDEAMAQLKFFIEQFPSIFKENFSSALLFSTQSSLAFQAILDRGMKLGCYTTDLLASVIKMKIEKNLYPEELLSIVLDDYAIPYERKIFDSKTWGHLAFSLAVMEGNTQLINKIRNQASGLIDYASAIKTAAQYGRNEILVNLLGWMNYSLKLNLSALQKELRMCYFFATELLILEAMLLALPAAIRSGFGETVRILLSRIENNPALTPAMFVARIEELSLTNLAIESNEPGILAMLRQACQSASVRVESDSGARAYYFFSRNVNFSDWEAVKLKDHLSQHR